MNGATPLLVGSLVLLGIVLGYGIRWIIIARKASSVEQQLALKINQAKQRAKDIELEAKERAGKLVDDHKREEHERKVKLDRFEDRLIKKEEFLIQDVRKLESREAELKNNFSRLTEEKDSLHTLQEKARQQLEVSAGLSADQAREQLLERIREEHQQDLARTVQQLERDRKEEIEKKSADIMLSAMQRYARSSVADATTSVFLLPNEDLKGKIIGREGRNIRTLERLTGVEVIVDETPESVILSSFDPLRREIARLALEKLIKDGRIQPAKIEEKVEEAREELTKRMEKIGEDAAMEIGIIDLPKEILQLLGRLHFRTSYGQNVLTHSIEMAHLASMIAADIGASVEVAKKGALLHDIGKAISHEVEGTHVELGRKILKKYNIDDRVIAAMEAHHEEYPFSTPESFIVAAVDVLSASRPGARRDSVENYLRRLEDLEKIAGEFPGVRQVYALSAGREVRVFVTPEKIDDFGALQLAKDISVKIKTEMKFPGEIKVNVIREMRAVEYAR
ncbi:MAG: ribonuclease Y [Candidatus Harrisonbacteria bacterium CG10_big_fil_rev_8_21_14_0_10_42_17]|uniref:Ribonuclease Y n=1 Tax=Candidatus Harrisonbacteria bacterium CG10_big_fil_rev_8_21_14_0_10_42_17 TaxID=1974584 RepID=A0A2M6WJD9_9BACT|nr:MAG: ribonuclease Y [Candidatus Harrisonbacteria bacterium CG10_big_fil_rev_8_21_14_0_10_42_17]